MGHNVGADLREARARWARLQPMFADLGISVVPPQIEEHGMAADLWLTNGDAPNRIWLANFISIGQPSPKGLLAEVRECYAITLARAALGLGGAHVFETIPLVLTQSVANWLGEVHADFDLARYAIIGEYIVARAETPGWRREYRLYQVKADATCDVPGCSASWGERFATAEGYAAHLCKQHREINPDLVYAQATV